MQLLKNSAFAKIRENLITNSSIHKINYVGSDVFEDASNDTIIIEYEKEKPKENHNIEISISSNNSIELITNEQFLTKQSLFEKDGFEISLSSNEELKICEKLMKSSESLLSAHFNIYQGIVSGLNGAFIFDSELPESIDSSNLKPYLLGSDFKKYSINDSSKKQILYLNKHIEIESFPNTKEWLIPFKERLEKRREVKKGVIPWYSLQWPRDKEQFEQPKILFQKIRNQTLHKRLVGTLDTSNYYLGDGVIFLTSKSEEINELKLALALLNSELYNFYFRKNFLDVNLKIMYLDKTPYLSLKQAEKVIELVDKIIEIKKHNSEGNIAEFESEINNIIYKELNFNKNEIKIIENANAKSHTHLQFAQPTLRQKLQKSMSLPTLQTERKIKYENTTMYIKNRRNSNKFKAFGSYQTLCLTESLVLRNRLLFIY